MTTRGRTGHFIGAPSARAGIVRGKPTYMINIFVAEILALSVQARIGLVGLIWDCIAAVPQAIEVPPEVNVDLAARLAEFERDPEAGYAWDQVKEQLKNGSWRTD